MKQTLLSLLAALALTTSSARAEIIDDFSAGGWREFSSTPGEMSIEPGKMRLVDAEGQPEWITASKTFTVDFEKTPFFLVKVADVSDYGTVKLIRKEPYDKKVAISIDRPGLYAVNMRSQFGWNGVGAVETCLYANGDEEEITYEYVKYAAKLSQEEQSLIKARATTGNVRLRVEVFEVVPSFNACSFYLPAPRPDALFVTYRKTGGDWLEALQPPHIAEDDMVRGSIVDLDEDTSYEIKVTRDNGEILARNRSHPM